MKFSAKSGWAIRHHLALLLHDDGTDFDRTRRYRFQVFLRVGLPCLVYFLINDLILGSYVSASIILACILLQTTAAKKLKKLDQFEIACRYYMLSLCLLLGTSHLWDGQMNSISLWLIPILPMSAAFLIGAKAAIFYLGIATAIVCGAMISSQFIATEQWLQDTEIQCLAIRLSGMVFFGSSALLSHTSTRNQRRMLKAQRNEVERIKSEHDSAAASKSTFFANISHEIRTPMNGILGMTQHLLSCRLPVRVQDSVKTMHHCAEELLALLNQILDLSALEIGDRCREVQVLDFTQEVQEQVQALQAQYGQKLLIFQDPGHEVKIQADPELLSKAIRIICGFAGQVTVSREIKLEVVTDPYSNTGLGGELAVRYHSATEDTSPSKSYQDVAHHSDTVHSASVSLSIAEQIANLMDAQLEVTDRDSDGFQTIYLRFMGSDEAAESKQGHTSPEGGFVPLALERIHRKFARILQKSNRSESSGLLLGIHFIVIPPFFIYSLDAWLYNHQLAFTVYLSTAWLWGVAAVLNYRTRFTRVATWLTVVSALLLMAFLNLADGQIRSESLWLMPLVPVGALFVLGRRAFYSVYLASILIILGIFVGTIYFPIAQEYPQTFMYILTLRVVTLHISGCMCVLAAYVSRKYYVQYKRERVEMLNALRASERAHGEKSKFLTNMSHEIRTPMNGILGLAESLVDQGLPEEQHHTITTIHRCGGHLLSLLGDVLDLSELNEKPERLSSVPMNLGVILDDVRNLFQATAQLKDISIQTEGSNLALQVMGDPTRLMQVLSNLVGNAIKFSDYGRIVIALNRADPCLRNKKPGYDIQIEVRDQGIGIPDSKVDALFQSFVQIEASSGPDRGGTGLGLAISRRLVRAMGGELEVESELGKGSVFRLNFWLENVAESRASMVEHSSLQQSISLDDVRERIILVVDDNAINLKVAEVSLQRFGYHPKVARSGEEAIELANATHFDAILMDIRMPGMDGIEATRVIRQGGGLSSTTPIIAFSADSYEDQKKLCMEAGMNDHLSKPFRATELQAKLQSLWKKVEKNKHAA